MNYLVIFTSIFFFFFSFPLLSSDYLFFKRFIDYKNFTPEVFEKRFYHRFKKNLLDKPSYFSFDLNDDKKKEYFVYRRYDIFNEISLFNEKKEMIFSYPLVKTGEDSFIEKIRYRYFPQYKKALIIIFHREGEVNHREEENEVRSYMISLFWDKQDLEQIPSHSFHRGPVLGWWKKSGKDFFYERKYDVKIEEAKHHIVGFHLRSGLVNRFYYYAKGNEWKEIHRR